MSEPITLDDIELIFEQLWNEGVSPLALSRVANRVIWRLMEADMAMWHKAMSDRELN